MRTTVNRASNLCFLRSGLKPCVRPRSTGRYLSIHFCSTQQEELTSLHLIRVAKRLTNRLYILQLGALLELEPHVIEAELGSTSQVVEATYRVLELWRRSVATPGEAYRTLKRALTECNLKQIAQDALEN